MAQIHPSVLRMLAYFVAPMSLIPPLMYVYAQRIFPGAVTPLVEPPLSFGELAVVGVAFFLLEIVMVALMGAYIRQMAESRDIRAAYSDAYSLAAIAPAPLWLAALALFVPSVWFNVAAIVVAWAGSVALIRHGVRPLLKVEDHDKAQRLAAAITAAGVGLWLGLLAVFVLLLGMLMGWR